MMQRELLCARECLRFSLRHPRYFVIFLLLYARSLGRWKDARPARIGYAFLQLFDDFMDGDRPCPESLEKLALRTRVAWNNGVFSADSVLSRLEQSFHTALKTLPMTEGDTAHADVAELLEAMQFDSERRTLRLRISSRSLKEHLLKTFRPSVNLLLLCSGCRARARDVPHVMEALCWCSVVRDFTEDMGKGLINIPAESLPPEVQDTDLATNPKVQEWLREERRRGNALLEASAVEVNLLASKDPTAARILRTFTRSMRKYLKD